MYNSFEEWVDANGYRQMTSRIELRGTPRLGVVGEVGGSPLAFKVFGGAASGVPHFFRATANAGDDIVAGARLLAGYPDTFQVNLDDVLPLVLGSPLTRLDIVLCGTVTIGSPDDTNGRSVIVDANFGTLATEAAVRANMLTWTFDESDNVLTAQLKTSGVLDTNHASIEVRGASHA